MSDTTIDLQPPLPDGLRRARLTWLAAATGKPKPTTAERAIAALLERQLESGFTDQVRLSVQEADEFLRQVDRAQGRRARPTPRRTTTPAPAPTGQTRQAPRKTPLPRTSGTTAPAPRTGTTTAPRTTPTGRLPTANRTTCGRCGGRLQSNGPKHVVHVEDLNAFYRKTFSPEMLATTTVYEYECTACHHLDTFATTQ
jgi:hypothetical protein